MRDCVFMSALESEKELLTRYRKIASVSDFIFVHTIDGKDKNSLCRRWLYAWEKQNLEQLRSSTFQSSKWRGEVTLLIHSFQPDEAMFFVNEFPILHTWKMLGSLPVVIITDRETEPMASFKRRYPNDVTICRSDYLKRGDPLSLSHDCLCGLDKYFNTEYCLVIQDDGFPIRSNLDDFLGKWDYIGAPCVTDRPRQYLADILLRDCLNGGFSLRTHNLCAATVKAWQSWGHVMRKYLGWTISEDWFYSTYSRYNPIHRLRFRFPWATQARRFSVMDMIGGIDIRKFKNIPFGVHGPTTVFLYKHVLEELGYAPLTLHDLLQG